MSRPSREGAQSVDATRVSAFVLHRTRSGGSEADMSDISSKTQLGEQNSIRILLIDESLPRAQLLQSALREAGVRDIVMFHRTDGLFDQVREVRPDVILIEVESPKRDTLEQLSLIREHNPMPVVMFTQDYESQSIQAAVSSGVCAYVVDGVNKQQV